MSMSRREPSSSSSRHVLLLVSTSTVVVSIATALLVNYHHRQTVKRLQQEWENRRQEERTGRIRAEVKLRTLLKEEQQQQQQQQQQRQVVVPIADDNDKDKPQPSAPPVVVVVARRTMLLTAIGTVTSPFTKRMGTPRQPGLCPASRGYIQFGPHIPASTLDGMEHYSHVWVVFEFHANTLVQVKKTKIRPPRAGGIKMGQLATRSPHRPNCLGLSLVTVERWDCQTKRLHMRGIDLVNGTPVYDIKPFVPWDVPTAPPGAVVPAPLQQQKQHNSDNGNGNGNHVAFFKVPNWVSQTEDVLSRVDFTPAARDALCTLVSQRRLAPLYTNDNDGFVAALATLQQILAQDPRSSHKGLKANARGTTSYAVASSCSSNRSNNSNNSKKRQDKTDDARSPPFYSLVFCQVQVDFVVNYATSHVQVVQCLAVDFDDAAYVDGVPLISEQQQQQRCSHNKY